MKVKEKLANTTKEIVDCMKEGFTLDEISEVTGYKKNTLTNNIMTKIYSRYEREVDFSTGKNKFKKLQAYLMENKDSVFKFRANRGVSNPVKKNKGAVNYRPVVPIRKEYALEVKLKKEIEELQDRISKLQLKLEVLEELKKELGA